MIKITHGCYVFLFTLFIALSASAQTTPVDPKTNQSMSTATNTAGTVTNGTPTVDTQRYVIIHNDAPITIYPVIQVPQDGNCVQKSTRVNRIKFSRGVKQGETVRINIPGKSKDNARSCWYQSGRVYLFSVDIDTFESRLKAQNQHSGPADPDIKNDAPVCTMLKPDKTPLGQPIPCPAQSAGASYPLDSPAQLAEYTFDADDDQGNRSSDPDVGTLKADIDLSYVDQAYLPMAITIDNQGATSYMGTTMNLDTFNSRVNQFIPKVNWSAYAAYTEENWNNNIFSTLVPQSLQIPAGYNLITLVNIQAPSDLYTLSKSTLKSLKPMTDALGPCAALDPTKPQCESDDQRGCCNPPCIKGDDRCFCNKGCVLVGLTAGNACCPQVDPNGKKTMLSCCDSSNGPTPPPSGPQGFMVDKTTVPKGSPASNPSVENLVARWKKWIGVDPEVICKQPEFLEMPFFTNPEQKQAFCKAFQATVQYVWTAVQTLHPSCYLPGKGVNNDNCMLQNIIGYNVDKVSGRLPESVQALQRSVPWNDPAGSEPLFQLDKWLLFWAPYDSVYNLNPYARFVHNDQEGINAVAYSFSIDDKYGNFRDKGTGFLINVGGDGALENKTPYDPYQNYAIDWARNWDHANVCGRQVTINGQPGNERITFWKNGQKQDSCEIILYPTANDQPNLKIMVKETQISSKDNYTGIVHEGIPSLQLDPPTYCKDQAKDDPIMSALCDGVILSPKDFKIVPGQPIPDDVYLNVDTDSRPKVVINVPDAPPKPAECKPACTPPMQCVNGTCQAVTVTVQADSSELNLADQTKFNCNGLVLSPDKTSATCNISNNVLPLSKWDQCSNVTLSFDAQGTLIKPTVTTQNATSCGAYCVKLGLCSGSAPSGDTINFVYGSGTMKGFQCTGGSTGDTSAQCPIDASGNMTIINWSNCQNVIAHFEKNSAGNYRYVKEKSDAKIGNNIINPGDDSVKDINITPVCP